jgi:hypothetical protein
LYSSAASKNSRFESKNKAVKRLFFATSNPVTAALWRTLGFFEKYFKNFSIRAARGSPPI